MPSIINTLFNREWLRLWRSRMTLWLLGFNVLLIVLVMSLHWQQQQAFNHTQQHWQAVNDDLWQNQPDRHPHRVAHYGSLAFRSQSPLSFLDAGINPYVGNALFLEAHHQNSGALRQYVTSARELALSYVSVSTLVLIFWPLTLIALAHSVISSERSSGNFSLLVSLGVSRWQWLVGKSLPYISLTAMYLLVLSAISSVYVLFLSENNISYWLDFASVLLLYFLYSVAWVVTVCLISMNSDNNAKSLLLAFILWIAWVVLIPRISTSLVQMASPTVPRVAFDVQQEKAISAIGDSHNPNDPYFNAFKQKTLAAYQVERVEDLPVNWRGVVMQEGERITKSVFDDLYGKVQQTYQHQVWLLNITSVMSLYIAVKQRIQQSVQSDAQSYYDFEQQAEAYRYQMITDLNDIHANEVQFATDKATRVDNSNWQTFSSFEHDHTGSQASNLWLLLSALFWFGGLGFMWYWSKVKQS